MNRGIKHRERELPYPDEYDRVAKRRKDDPGRPSGGGDHLIDPQYRTLCLSQINSRVPDDDVTDMIYREFKKFGEFNVKIVNSGGHRLAYVNFRYPEDARDAKHAFYDKLVMFDLPVRIDTVYTMKQPHRSVSPSIGRADECSTLHGVRLVKEGNGNYDSGQRDVGGSSGYLHEKGMSSKNEPKFPHHLHHIQPEDDDSATRTLFIGNLEYDITQEELKAVFDLYGYVEDVDIKRPAQGHGNSYAFVKFFNLDMAHRAKVEMSGRFIRRYQCKIGYGKATPSSCVWVGGIGPWINTDDLRRAFDRYGPIQRIDWPDGKNYAYVLYDSVEAAKSAVHTMRGYQLGGPDRRLRVDYADVNQINSPPNLPRTGGHNGRGGGVYRDLEPLDRDVGARGNPSYHQKSYSRSDWLADSRKPVKLSPERACGASGGVGGVRNTDKYYEDHRKNPERHTSERNYRTQSRGDVDVDRDNDRHLSSSRGGGGGRSRNRASSVDNNNAVTESDAADGRTKLPKRGAANPEEATDIADFAACLPVVWSGNLMLKNSAFLTRMHQLSGDVRLVDTLMRDASTTERPALKITQRLRMDEPKLGEVQRRISLAGRDGCSILLAMPAAADANDVQPAGAQQRPLKNLVTYLKQKDAAGVISLPPDAGHGRETGLLHAFPPCTFAQQYLAKHAPKLAENYAKDDHLLIMVVRVTST